MSRFLFSAFLQNTLKTAKRDCRPRRSPGLAALRASILPASSETVQWLACDFPPYSRAAATARSSAVYVAADLSRRPGWFQTCGDLSLPATSRPLLHFRAKISQELRLPVHEVCDDCDGATSPAMGLRVTAEKFPRRLTTKIGSGFRVCVANAELTGFKACTHKPSFNKTQAKQSRVDGHSIPSRR